jgi:hypothetical protein
MHKLLFTRRRYLARLESFQWLSGLRPQAQPDDTKAAAIQTAAAFLFFALYLMSLLSQSCSRLRNKLFMPLDASFYAANLWGIW